MSDTLVALLQRMRTMEDPSTLFWQVDEERKRLGASRIMLELESGTSGTKIKNFLIGENSVKEGLTRHNIGSRRSWATIMYESEIESTALEQDHSSEESKAILASFDDERKRNGFDAVWVHISVEDIVVPLCITDKGLWQYPRARKKDFLGMIPKSVYLLYCKSVHL